MMKIDRKKTTPSATRLGDAVAATFFFTSSAPPGKHPPKNFSANVFLFFLSLSEDDDDKNRPPPPPLRGNKRTVPRPLFRFSFLPRAVQSLFPRAVDVFIIVFDSILIEFVEKLLRLCEDAFCVRPASEDGAANSHLVVVLRPGTLQFVSYSRRHFSVVLSGRSV